MNSKECLELAILEYEKETIDDENNQWVKNVLKGLKQIKQDLDRLEHLENENKELIRTQNVILLNSKDYILKNMELEKENQELKEQVDYYKKEMESEQCFRESNQNHLMKYIQAIKILKEKFDITVDNTFYPGIIITETNELGNNDCVGDCLSQEQCSLLKQVFESVGDGDE